ncbi:MAG: hypothetical protein AAGE52_19425, partial [Myxococcota bacterium]
MSSKSTSVGPRRTSEKKTTYVLTRRFPGDRPWPILVENRRQNSWVASIQRAAWVASIQRAQRVQN